MAINSVGKIFLSLAILSICIFCCASPNAGGTSTGNGVVVGKLYQPGGKGPAQGDSVVLRSCDYLMDIKKLSKRSTIDIPFIVRTCTDDSGYFRFNSIPKGMYCIEGHDSGNNRVLIEVDSSLFQSEIIELPPDTLKAAATIQGKILSGYASSGTYVRVLGLDAGAKVGSDSTFSLYNMPEGNLRLIFTISSIDGTPFDTVIKVSVKAGVDTLISPAIEPRTIPSGITFKKTFGSKGDMGNCVQQTSDGGYIIVGSTNYQGPGGGDVYLIKTDAIGTVAWTKTFGGEYEDDGNCVEQTSDGGYIIVGTSASSVSGTGDGYVCLIKTDAAGTSTWTRTFKDSLSSIGHFVRQTSDGGYIIVGAISICGNNGVIYYTTHVYLIKTDAIGTAVWTKTFGGDSVTEGHCVRQTSDGGYIIVGNTKPPGLNTNVCLIKTDAIGTAAWTKTFGGDSVTEGQYVQQTSDGGYIIVGNSWDNSTSDVYFIKTDVSGGAQWIKHFGGDVGYSTEGQCVQQTSDGGYIVSGRSYSDDATVLDVCLIKTDVTGVATWIKTFNTMEYDYGNYVWQTTDGGYIITGRTTSDNNNGVLLLKTDEHGDVK